MQEHTYLISDPLCRTCSYVRFTPLVFKDCNKCLTYIKENLIMDKNSIKITIDNYCGQRITFTMSEDAEIESSLCIKDSYVTEVHINAYDKDILIEKEDI